MYTSRNPGRALYHAMSINGKILPTKSKVAGRKPSYQFSIVSNDKRNGVSVPTVIKHIGTLNPDQYQKMSECAGLLKRAKQAVLDLIWDEVITVQDGKKVMHRFENYDIEGRTLKDRATVVRFEK